MRKILIIMMCIACFTGCSFYSTEQKVLRDTRKEMSKLEYQDYDICYYNADESNMVHMVYLEDHDLIYSYYHYDGMAFQGDFDTKKGIVAEDQEPAESQIIHQQAQLLEKLINEELQLVNEMRYPGLYGTNMYEYRIPSNVMAKYQLEDGYTIVIIEKTFLGFSTAFGNIRLELGNHKEGYRYYLNMVPEHLRLRDIYPSWYIQLLD